MTPDLPIHRPCVDLARLLAAFGIVWAHAHAPGEEVGYVALALFLVLSGFFATRSLHRSRGAVRFLARVPRLLVPWLVWSLIYRLVGLRVADGPVALLSDPWSLLVGGWLHLWYLPFLMAAMLAVPLVARIADLRIACALLVPVSVGLLLVHGRGDLPVPLPQWCFAFPPFLWGCVAAMAETRGRSLLPLIAAAAISALTFALTAEPWALALLVAALLFRWVWQLPDIDFGRDAGRMAFGVYLVHPLFILVAYKLFGAEAPAAWVAIFAFAASFLGIVVLRRVPGLGRVV